MISEDRPETRIIIRIIYEARDRLSFDELVELTDWLTRLYMNEFSASIVQGALSHPNRKVRIECQKFLKALGKKGIGASP